MLTMTRDQQESTKLKKYLLSALLLFLGVAAAGMWWGYAHLTGLVQERLKTLAGEGVSVGRVTARWNRIELQGVRTSRIGNGHFPDRFSCGRILIRPAFLSLFRGALEIDEILLEKPYLLLEINADGTIAGIRPPRPAQPRQPGAAHPVKIGSFRIVGGAIDLLDWRAGRKAVPGISNQRDRYHLTGLREIAFTAAAFELPFTDRSSPVRLELAAKGGGQLQVAGDYNPKARDARLRFDLKGLNIVPYRPYFLKPGDLDVAAGSLSGSCELSIARREVKAPGSLHLKGLALDHSGAKGVLLGVPAWALLAFMTDNKDEITVPFSVSGNLDNPRFSFHQTLAEQVATGLSAKIGVPTVSGIGKGILNLGEKGVQGVLKMTGIKK